MQLIDIASAATVSKSEALRCFKDGTATSPINYLIQYRLNKAKELLLHTELTITDISFKVGFDSIAYFDRMFKRAFGVTPQNIRKYADIPHN
ncbi:helix-turn-helix transcriptional regulator [Paenibacillus xylanexedens]|uniref:helix-turn-helix transcriptional regulator n=1 Tax=Paenibacillus xylanexedens TaxID=528191 RepID=UPI0011A0FB78